MTVSIASKPEPRAYQMELAFVLVGARLRHNEALIFANWLMELNSSWILLKGRAENG